MADVRFERVRKIFSKVTAVDDVELEIGDGEFMVLLGPWLRQDDSAPVPRRAGEGGRRPRLDRRSRRDELAARAAASPWSSRATRLPPCMCTTTSASVSRWQKERKARIAERVQSAASLLHIEDMLDRYPSQLSGGQRQRRRPRHRDQGRRAAWDEPLSNLDALLRMEMRAELKALLGSSMRRRSTSRTTRSRR